jgi:hypothetical protein
MSITYEVNGREWGQVPQLARVAVKVEGDIWFVASGSSLSNNPSSNVQMFWCRSGVCLVALCHWRMAIAEERERRAREETERSQRGAREEPERSQRGAQESTEISS